eukprot:1166279-Rhodomonas_salina.4
MARLHWRDGGEGGRLMLHRRARERESMVLLGRGAESRGSGLWLRGSERDRGRRGCEGLVAGGERERLSGDAVPWAVRAKPEGLLCGYHPGPGGTQPEADSDTSRKRISRAPPAAARPGQPEPRPQLRQLRAGTFEAHRDHEPEAHHGEPRREPATAAAAMTSSSTTQACGRMPVSVSSFPSPGPHESRGPGKSGLDRKSRRFFKGVGIPTDGSVEIYAQQEFLLGSSRTYIPQGP